MLLCRLAAHCVYNEKQVKKQPALWFSEYRLLLQHRRVIMPHHPLRNTHDPHIHSA